MEITQDILENLEKMTPGYVALYAMQGTHLKTIYTSPNIHELNGFSPEEYKRRTGENALDIVVSEDVPLLLAGIRRCMETGEEVECHFRVHHRTRGMDWAHAKARLVGEMDGIPILIIVYVNASVESDIYQRILDSQKDLIYVADRQTYELLYANDAARKRLVDPVDDILGKACYCALQGREVPCADCPARKIQPNETLTLERNNPDGTCMRITGNLLEWCGHDAFLHCVSDITHERAEQAEIENALRREEDLVRGIGILNGHEAFDDRIASLLEDVGNNLEADRAYIFEIEDDRVRNRYGWCAPQTTSERGVLQDIDLGYISHWLDELGAGRCVIMPDIEAIADLHPDEYRIMSSQGIRSYIEAPIIVDDELRGFMGVDNPAPARLEQTGDMLLWLSYFVSAVIIRENNERDIRESQERFEFAIEGAELGVWEYDIASHTIFSPSNSFAKFGVTGPISDVPQSLLPMFDEGEQAKLLDMYRRIEAGEPRVTGDFWMRWHPSSARRCERTIYTVVKDEDGKPRTAYGIGMNCTAQKLEQESFENTLQQVLAINPNTFGTYQLNLTKNTCDAVYSNDDFSAAATQFKTVDELVEAAAAGIADLAERESFLAHLSREPLLAAFSEGRSEVSETYHWRVESGAMHWITTRNMIMQHPQTQDIISAVTVVDVDDEITRRRVLEFVSHEAYDHISIIYPREEKIRVLYRIPDAPSAFEEEQRESELDYEELCRAVAGSWVHPESREAFMRNSALDNIVRRLDEDGRYAYEIKAIGNDGSIGRKMLGYHYFDETHESILETQRDTTDLFEEQQARQDALARQIRREKKLRDEAQRANQMKSDFLSNVSHDMRTPLNAVLGYTDIARSSHDMDEVQDYLGKIAQSGVLLQQLIDDTLDLNKITSGLIELKEKPVDACDIFGDIMTAIAPSVAAKDIHLVEDLSRSPVEPVVVDIVRVRQIFLNLMNNAIKFTSQGGTITFSVERLAREGDVAHERISISDTGCGMSPEFITKIFEPFSQERTEETADIGGSGLGLAIVKSLVDIMGGRIGYESELGKGTTVVVHLDFRLAQPSEMKVPQEQSGDTFDLTGRKVLLVEDNPMNTEIAQMLLEREGMDVDCAANGAEGIAAFEASQVGEYDLVLMDVRMPVMDGLEATRRIRALERKDATTVPIIAMTANTYEDDVRECLAAGMDAHVGKPVDPQILYSVLGRVLNDDKRR